MPTSRPCKSEDDFLKKISVRYMIPLKSLQMLYDDYDLDDREFLAPPYAEPVVISVKEIAEVTKVPEPIIVHLQKINVVSEPMFVYEFYFFKMLGTLCRDEASTRLLLDFISSLGHEENEDSGTNSDLLKNPWEKFVYVFYLKRKISNDNLIEKSIKIDDIADLVTEHFSVQPSSELNERIQKIRTIAYNDAFKAQRTRDSEGSLSKKIARRGISTQDLASFGELISKAFGANQTKLRSTSSG